MKFQILFGFQFYGGTWITSESQTRIITMKNREFVRKTFHQIRDTDIEDLKKGAVSILVVHNIPLSPKDLFKELNRIGRFQKQDMSRDFIQTVTISKKHRGLPWHTDRSYHTRPPRFVALYASRAPEKKTGGDTLYCDLQKAYQDLPEKTMKKIEGLQLLHFNRYMLFPKIRRKDIRKFHILSSIHPLVQSDERGKYLFFNWDYTDDFPLKGELCRHIYQTNYIYKHHWSSFDLVISNNFKTNHKRNRFNPGQSPRTLSRFHII